MLTLNSAPVTNGASTPVATSNDLASALTRKFTLSRFPVPVSSASPVVALRLVSICPHATTLDARHSANYPVHSLTTWPTVLFYVRDTRCQDFAALFDIIALLNCPNACLKSHHRFHLSLSVAASPLSHPSDGGQ